MKHKTLPSGVTITMGDTLALTRVDGLLVLTTVTQLDDLPVVGWQNVEVLESA